MRVPRTRRRANGHALDRLVSNIEHGRFERALSGVTAAGAVVTTAEVWLEHDRASFGNRMMWLPVALTPLAALAGAGAVSSKRVAKTLLPLTSAVVVVNGLQGTYLHARGIAQRPGGWSEPRFNGETGPPPFAPLLVCMVGGMGLLAAILRREDA
jgi:hypothetical protein